MFPDNAGAMRRLSSETLTDPDYRVPEPQPGESGMAWLRGQVVRFCEGAEHQRRREYMQDLLDSIAGTPYVEDPTRSLLAALQLPLELADDVALASAAYQPHTRAAACSVRPPHAATSRSAAASASADCGACGW